MIKKIERNYLEINSLNDLKETRLTQNGFCFEKVKPENFQINKFFYRNVGKKHHWVDRLVWTDKNWIDYTTDNKVKTFIVKKYDDLAGYFELIFHAEQNEVEIAYLGLLEQYHNKKIGSFLLSTAIKNAFLEKPQRVWVHTCSLDHKNALKNYIARGMKIFKKETVLV